MKIEDIDTVTALIERFNGLQRLHDRLRANPAETFLDGSTRTRVSIRSAADADHIMRMVKLDMHHLVAEIETLTGEKVEGWSHDLPIEVATVALRVGPGIPF